jgi:hypothetical protein
VSSRFVWCGLAKDITSWAKSCLHCQRSKIHRHTACCRSPSPSLSGVLLISTLTWWALYSTVVVATTFSRSLIAHQSGWKQFPLLKHLRRRVHVLEFFLANQFWGAEMITSHCGPQFTSNVWSQLCDTLHIMHRQTIATILSQTVQSEDFTVASRMHYVQALPRPLGPRRSLDYSSAYVHS